MQPKVSMIIPCYNKVKYIGNMFNSILAQKWDHIELILVNDGSTDGTRGVISEYEPKFGARGFGVIIIDQENQGVAAAVRNGLMRVTGELICQVDADDELDSEYVSTMAGWLWENPEDQWVVCNYDRIIWGRSFSERRPEVNKIKPYPYKIYESYLLHRVKFTLHTIMVRTAFLKSCRILENFVVEPCVSQEPQVWFPLAITGVKPIYIPKPLYKWITREASLMQQSLQTYEKALTFTTEYWEILEKTIISWQQPSKYDHALINIGRIMYQQYAVSTFPEYDDIKMAEELVDIIKENGMNDRRINKDIVRRSGFLTLSRYISNILIGYEPECVKIERRGKGRIIAYAAFGKAAKGVETGLHNSVIRPDVYWDIEALDGVDIAGIPVVKPDFADLEEDDVVLLLLLDAVIVDSVNKQIEATAARNNVWYYNEVVDFLTQFYYGR